MKNLIISILITIWGIVSGLMIANEDISYINFIGLFSLIVASLTAYKLGIKPPEDNSSKLE